MIDLPQALKASNSQYNVDFNLVNQFCLLIYQDTFPKLESQVIWTDWYCETQRKLSL